MLTMFVNVGGVIGMREWSRAGGNSEYFVPGPAQAVSGQLGGQ